MITPMPWHRIERADRTALATRRAAELSAWESSGGDFLRSFVQR
jgi:hypothetical protein